MDKKFQIIKVIHRAFEDLDEVAEVAEVTVYRDANLHSNINFAWRVTQNFEGSWSRDKYMPMVTLTMTTTLGSRPSSLL